MTERLAIPPEIAEAVASFRYSRFEGYQLDSLAWLALAPSWTEDLAEACKFPAPLPQFLDDMARAGLAVRDPENLSSTAEVARTLAAVWPYLQADHRREYGPMLRHHALQMSDPEEGLALLMLTRSESDDPEPDNELVERVHALPPDGRARLFVYFALQRNVPALFARAAAATADLPAGSLRVALRLALAEQGRHFTSAPSPLVTAEELEAIKEPVERAGALIKLGAIDRSLSPKADEAIAAVKDPALRALYWSVQSKVNGDASAGERSLKSALEVTETALRCRTLAAVAANCEPSMGRRMLELAWAAGSNVQDTEQRTSLLALTASQWAPVDPDGTFERASQLHPLESRVEVMLACLASDKLRTSEVDSRISREIESIPLQSLRDSMCLRLATLWPGNVVLREKGVQIAQRLTDETGRRNALLTLLPQLDPRQRDEISRRILNELRRVGDPAMKRSVLVRLMPCLDPRQISTALKIAADPKADRGFRVDEGARGEILEYIRNREGRLFLYNTACHVGTRITQAKEVGIPEGTQRWAHLAARMGESRRLTLGDIAHRVGLAEDAPGSEAGQLLTRQVRHLADAGDTAAALSWLHAGTLLAEVAGEDLKSAVLSGTHRVELRYRRAMDERHLRRYLERDEQAEAFTALRDGPDDRWALHFLGVGGVGKTMLLRHITARLAVKGHQRLATTRVDFDHISPEFPVRKPGLLLAELADELRIYGGSTRIEEKFAEFQDRLLSLHAELSTQPPPENPLININTEDFKEVVASFAALLRQLPPPVILILDTCEELSKLEPINSRLPSVEATFTILEQLHSQIPSVRVVFAGRRLLAQSGDVNSDGQPRWKADDRALGDRVRSLPARKDYLRLHVIRGFTPDEGTDFLERIADVALKTDQREAILERSCEASTPIPIIWSEQHEHTEPPRTNPFDLALYADWLRESPEILADVIRSGDTDPYVEMRIIRRLEGEPSVRRALPAAVLLRRFDEEMLRAVEPDDSTRSALFQQMRGHEWTDAQRDEELAAWFLEVNPNLRKRIENYFAAPARRLDLDTARAHMGPALDSMVQRILARQHWSRELSFTRLEPALRLQSPAAAARLWDAVDARATETAEWNWAFQICPQLLGEDNVGGSKDAPLRAAIRATLNAAQLHLQRDFDPRPAWAEVTATAEKHPDEEIKAWLLCRAGLFTASSAGERTALLQSFAYGWKPGSTRLLQAVAGYLARAYESETNVETDFRDLFFDGSLLPEDLASLLKLARGEVADGETEHQQVQHWADWRMPDCLTDRVRLEALLNRPTAVAR